MANILVIGSANTDMVVKTDRFPQPGETVLGGQFFMFPGGKGANQAVAAARMGGHVVLVGKVGRDIFGEQTRQGLQAEGIDTQHFGTHDTAASGVALITVDARGENEIVVASGANATVTGLDIKAAEAAFAAADLVLVQLEIPIEAIEVAADMAAAAGKKLMLNPAPAQLLSDALLARLYLITPNETEAAILTDIELDSDEALPRMAEALLQKGVQNVLITLGARGAYFQNADRQYWAKAPRVEAVDTTAAGDVFNGALAVALAEGLDWEAALDLACRAGAISVTRMGAQASAPYRNEVV
jgi:ribokinase